MEIHIPPPQFILWFAVASPAVVAILVLPRQRIPLVQRILPVALSVVVAVVMAAMAAKPHSFAWDAQGIRDDSFGPAEVIPWSEVRSPEITHDLWNSPYRPTVRTRGAAYDRFRAGEFSIASGERARMYLEVPGGDALVFRSGGVLHVYAPAHTDDLIATARAHCPALASP